MDTQLKFIEKHSPPKDTDGNFVFTEQQLRDFTDTVAGQIHDPRRVRRVLVGAMEIEEIRFHGTQLITMRLGGQVRAFLTASEIRALASFLDQDLSAPAQEEAA